MDAQGSGFRSEHQAYRTLLSPLAVGRHTLPNRVIMGSMHTRLEHMDRPLERQAAFYAARARGGVGLMVTGGFAPNHDGLMEEGGPILVDLAAAEALRPIPQAVHAEGSKILLQILHAGRYGKHRSPVGASAIPSPINPRLPRPLTAAEVESTIEDYVHCAELAAHAGFDGVEIMGSEGYLINQFTVERTNNRDDGWGGSVEKRHRFAVEIVRRTRERLGSDFLLMYRISAVDLVEGGADGNEILQLARAVEAAGADILNTGIGWHEARIPTIAYMVPRSTWRYAPARLKDVVSIPVVASNRINTPEVAEEILASGQADLISMARPFLADPLFIRKAAEGRADQINTCIACNQACLDYIFRERPATCLVNPRAGRELDFDAFPPPAARLRLAVVGAGAAGLACAVAAAERRHAVTLFEAAPEIGGQMNYARQIPGKQEFNEMLRYFSRQLALHKVDVRCGQHPTAAQLASEGYDQIVMATGVRPRRPDIPGIGHPKVVFYPDLLSGRVQAGKRVAIIGAGGIGFDVAEYLTQGGPAHPDMASFRQKWGVDESISSKGGLKPAELEQPARQVTLLQRKPEKPGRTLGLTTGWALKSSLAQSHVEMLSGCEYLQIDDAGLHLTVNGKPRLLEVDNIIICAGQESERGLADELSALGIKLSIIGGAELAAELDALRAIDQGTRLAMTF
ncbi:NADPH-dependent 2,4-dienoyl-CoA reductase [Noviherbaspirillum malthae]|uniref:NADPH-dependent 2,4-dienoyl-CoA reductase n=1 Tax=Noviherbaspirillum malthae TaxID=1260987 RepID=UPI00188EFEDA|nr:NADPH-dependent 2,4-dienoyl-CoA reductase [Noviherbaspirillum malthae]